MANQRHIFLVDDDEEDRELFSSAISMIDSSVILTELTNGLELIEILENTSSPKPEIVFLDLNMPILNGLDCLKKLGSAHYRPKGVKLVVLTTSSNPDNVADAYRYGADFYMVKPSTFKDLKMLIEKMLTVYSVQQPPIPKTNFVVRA